MARPPDSFCPPAAVFVLVRAALLLVPYLLLLAPAHAASATSTQISLPKGPGSIEGLASADFSPSLASGTASYSIPILVPPGAAGFGPSLAFAYDSGGGVSELGLGWRLAGVPRLRRRTEEGLPRFAVSDRFELEGIGIPSELLEMPDGFYRPRYEDGSFVRLAKGRRADEWEARTKAGAVLRFGGEGFVEVEDDNVSAFLLREQRDRRGHRVAYEWDTAEGHALLTRVVWNDFDAASRNEVTFDYENRPDPGRRFSSGIAETLTKRLRTVTVRHGGSLVRRYDLAYGGGLHPALSAITLVGSDGTSAMPPARFAYTEARLDASTDHVVTMTNVPGVSPASRDVALTDLDGDGLPDLLLGKAGSYRSYLNDDGTRWRPARDWKAEESPAASLGAPGVQLADVDADGAADLLVKSGTDAFRYFPGARDAFGTTVALSPVPSFTFEDPDVRLADLDGDRRADVIVTTASGIAIGYRKDAGWSEPGFVPGTESFSSLRFSSGRTSLCDVNGDRVQDLCALRSGGMTYFLGRGRGRFEPGASATGVPEFAATAPFVLEDLNGDGWVDLVRAGVHEVAYALAEREGEFGSVRLIEDTPAKGPHTTVHYADMNGSGTTDILWVDVTGDGTSAWRYLELFPEGKAGLLRRIDNGLGKVQTIEYAPAALDAAAARAAGSPWKTRLNIAMPVVRRITVDASVGDPLIVSEYTYRDGAYDSDDRTFAGFGLVTEREPGDEWTPTLVTDSAFEHGLSARVLRGVPVSQVTRDESGAVFTRTTYEHEIRQVGESVSGVFTELAVRLSAEIQHVEGTRTPRVTRTEYEQDARGNVIEERRWGDIAVEGDEAFIHRTYAENAEEWLLGYLATETLSDAKGQRVSEKRKYYDGAPFEGLPLGEVSRGEVTREEAWVGPGPRDFELVVGTEYDADGNPVETRDARGGGHLFSWADDHTSIRSESVKLEEGRTLVEHAEVDAAFGNVTSVTEYSGQVTRYGYDAFGRLAAVIRPGDTEALPTASHRYFAGAPLSRIVTELRVESGREGVERSETLQDGAGRVRGTLTVDDSHLLLAGVQLHDARGNARRAVLPHFVPAESNPASLVQEEGSRGTDTWRDATGRVLRTRSPSGIESRTEYAPLATRHWDGGQNDAKSPYEHTPVITRTDGLGRMTAHEQTLAGQPLIASYTHDPAGALLTRTDPEGATARYAYDGRGRRLLVSDPDQGEHSFSYDETGNLTGHTYPDQKTARFTYDLAGRALTQDADGDGTPDSTRYWDGDREGNRDALYQGKLVEVIDESGGARHTFDERGRTVATVLLIGTAEYTVGSEFDAQDRELKHFYPDGSSIYIHRNPRGQISGYGSALQFDYGEDGLETARRFSTGVHVATGYDDDRRRTDLRVTALTGAIIEHLRWRYDPGGNLTAMEDRRVGVADADDRSERYTYDNLYRLSAVTGTWGNTGYRYSPTGSLLSRQSTVPSQLIDSVRYGKRPHAPVAFDGHEVVYDARGRMTSDGQRTYAWSDADELLEVMRAGGGSERNTYDAEGKRRVRLEQAADGKEATTHFIDPWSEVKDGKLTRYIVHGGQRIVRLGPTVRRISGVGVIGAGLAATAMSIHGAGAVLALVLLLALVARIPKRARPVAALLGTAFALVMLVSACSGGRHGEAPDEGASVTELGEADTLLTTDLLGSLLGETTGSGKQTGRFAAYPYGATRYDTSGESQKYAAVPRDAHVGLDAMGARFYAPERGLFTSADPVGVNAPERLVTEDFAAANPYAYAKNSPLIAADRDGEFWHIAVGAGIGFLVGGGIEAARQYYTTGRISEPGRVFAAATGGAVSGALVAACPAAGLAGKLVVEGGSGAAGGVAQRLVESGGKSAGSVGDAVLDAGISVVTAGAIKGGAKLVKAVGKKAAGAATAAASGARAAEGASESVSMFRAVSPAEFADVMRTGGFRGVPGSLAGKQFGMSLKETMSFANKFPDAAAILRVEVPRSTFEALEFSRTIDSFIFRGGVVTAQPGAQVDLLNKTIMTLEHAF